MLYIYIERERARVALLESKWRGTFYITTERWIWIDYSVPRIYYSRNIQV